MEAVKSGTALAILRRYVPTPMQLSLQKCCITYHIPKIFRFGADVEKESTATSDYLSFAC